jgi:hypothetical protein
MDGSWMDDLVIRSICHKINHLGNEVWSFCSFDVLEYAFTLNFKFVLYTV